MVQLKNNEDQCDEQPETNSAAHCIVGNRAAV